MTTVDAGSNTPCISAEGSDQSKREPESAHPKEERRSGLSRDLCMSVYANSGHDRNPRDWDLDRYDS